MDLFVKFKLKDIMASEAAKEELGLTRYSVDEMNDAEEFKDVKLEDALKWGLVKREYLEKLMNNN